MNINMININHINVHINIHMININHRKTKFVQFAARKPYIFYTNGINFTINPFYIVQFRLYI